MSDEENRCNAEQELQIQDEIKKYKKSSRWENYRTALDKYVTVYSYRKLIN